VTGAGVIAGLEPTRRACVQRGVDQCDDIADAPVLDAAANEVVKLPTMRATCRRQHIQRKGGLPCVAKTESLARQWVVSSMVRPSNAPNCSKQIRFRVSFEISQT